jgi:hypothetical protein
VIHEDTTEAAITKEGAAELSHICRCFHPTRRLRIEISKFLQLSILFFRQKLDAHGRRHIEHAILRFEFLSRIQRFTSLVNVEAGMVAGLLLFLERSGYRESLKDGTEEGKAARFYGHLYAGLYCEATGDGKRAKEHILTAADKYPNSHYMWDVAAAHAKTFK